MKEETKKAPFFVLRDADGKEVSLTTFTGSWLILYFYPKDDTPGCTTEACDFSNLSMGAKGVQIVGISPDASATHRRFIDKYGLTVSLLSDPDKEVMKTYGAWGIKKNYGREYEGVIRSTFLIDPEGNLAFSWKNVKAKGHAQRVMVQLAAFEIGTG